MLTAALLTGCGRAINRSAERRIRDMLPQVLGPARQYQVHVGGSPVGTVEGHLAHVEVDGDDVQLAGGLLIDRLKLDLTNVNVDTRHGRVRSIGSAQFGATIGQATIDEALAGEAPDSEHVRKLQVRILAGDRATISGERVVFGVGVPFAVSGTLRVAAPQRIEIDPTSLSVVGIDVPGILFRVLKSRFEGAMDLSTLPFPVRVTAVTTEAGAVTLVGDADAAGITAKQ